MFSSLRTRFGIPGVISVIALVFALLAFAATTRKSRRVASSVWAATQASSFLPGLRRPTSTRRCFPARHAVAFGKCLGSRAAGRELSPAPLPPRNSHNRVAVSP